VRESKQWLLKNCSLTWNGSLDLNGAWKHTGLPILISDKIDFNPKLIRRDKEGHFILRTRLIHQEEIAIVNIYAPKFGTPNFFKQTLTRLTSTDRSQHNNSERLQYPTRTSK
jgi:hypothetical protein